MPMLHVVWSQIVLPERIRRHLEAEGALRSFKRRMAVFSAIIGVPAGFLPAIVLWACTGDPLTSVIFGLLMMILIVMGIYGWLPLIFGGTRIP